MRENSLQNIQFSSPDSTDYLRTKQWLEGTTGPALTIERRPFLFPLILAMADTFFPVPLRSTALFVIQALCWLATPNVLVAACRADKNNLWSIVWPFIALIGCVSLHLLTLHALTETLFVLMASIWCYLFTAKSVKNFALLFVISLLACLRPMYFVHAILWLVYCFVKLLTVPRGRLACFASLLLSASPIFAQLALVFHAAGIAIFSTSGDFTLRCWLANQVYRASLIDGSVPWEQGCQIMMNLSSPDLIHLLLSNWQLTISSWFNNLLLNNVLSQSNYAMGFPLLSKSSEITNAAFLGIHIIMAAMLSIALLKIRSKVLSSNLLWLLAFAAIHFALTGISYSQGDRLIVTAMPFWIVGYWWLISIVDQAQRPGSTNPGPYLPLHLNPTHITNTPSNMATYFTAAPNPLNTE